MGKFKISGKWLLGIGYPQGPAISVAMTVINMHYKYSSEAAVKALLLQVLESPEQFLEHEFLDKVAVKLHKEEAPERKEAALLAEPVPYYTYGSAFIDEGTRKQMNNAMRLPVTVAGALMADAHQGYGLPIGGVLATENSIIPYGVGVDIGCRMCMSILDLPEHVLEGQFEKFKKELGKNTVFGVGGELDIEKDDPVLEREEFREIPFLRRLKDKAVAQLGTSGSGNHFVEWGLVEIVAVDNDLNLLPGRYVALLSHSGSRGIGGQIAGEYTRLARELCPLPSQVQQLAYLDLNSEAGQEYWLAMNLAGDYASACHHLIHKRLIRAVGGNLLARVENHHNFAWKEMYEGREVIVHRKGATPAGKGVLGIIPGSMTAPGFIVRGRGEVQSLSSASHGAGRQMSRSAALQRITGHDMRTVLKEHGVTLIGGGLDEAPMAYKDINTVMAAQQELVDILGRFTPKIVRMADPGQSED
ncbi:MAG: RtcB family protein [Chitinophaga sp.]|uniref:RtcB family protein n=1 Tax=Chitinophaga sp. TaxID=1869181 RepID=UPI0025BC5115|nr:RtcB family protein [Chitinophaga sp.]MBV8254364.1 RtcB family protein [Chitinophaga sp.]